MRCIIVVVIVLALALKIESQVVCSLDELIRELIEDIEDNGKLDCLREILNPDEDNEKNEDRIKRKAAQWDSDCSFEAANDLWYIYIYISTIIIIY